LAVAEAALKMAVVVAQVECFMTLRTFYLLVL
jgi:hypothetical protein